MLGNFNLETFITCHNTCTYQCDLLYFSISALGYLLTLGLLTAAVIFAVEADDPTVYDMSSSSDIARLFCEVVVLAVIVVTVIQEMKELIKLV